MTPMTLRRSAILVCAGVLTAIATPRTATAQATETAVPVGPAAVGVGPNGATLRCRDGFYPPAGARDSACQDRGGVLVRFPLRRTPSRATEAQAAAARDAAARRSTRTATAPARADSSAPAGFEPYAVRRARADSINRAANTPPVGATLLCTDGTWIVRDTTQSRCATHGGVRVILPPTP